MSGRRSEAGRERSEVGDRRSAVECRPPSGLRAPRFLPPSPPRARLPKKEKCLEDVILLPPYCHPARFLLAFYSAPTRVLLATWPEHPEKTGRIRDVRPPRRFSSRSAPRSIKWELSLALINSNLCESYAILSAPMDSYAFLCDPIHFLCAFYAIAMQLQTSWSMTGRGAGNFSRERPTRIIPRKNGTCDKRPHIQFGSLVKFGESAADHRVLDGCLRRRPANLGVAQRTELQHAGTPSQRFRHARHDLERLRAGKQELPWHLARASTARFECRKSFAHTALHRRSAAANAAGETAPAHVPLAPPRSVDPG